jgi:nitroimidazol reductase NimA-like FMN-containing flavoprotein (pyridoxamine 5'-phosphate oxidase superfamily)
MEASEIASRIASYSFYLTLGTCEKNGAPWVAGLVYWVDDKGDFYVVSHADSKHMKHIAENPRVAFTIYNSTGSEKHAHGVQMSGRASILEKDSEIEEALRWAVIKRLHIQDPSLQDQVIHQKKSEYREVQRKIVRIRVEESFLNEADRRPHLVDVRTRVVVSPNLFLIRWDQCHLLCYSRL